MLLLHFGSMSYAAAIPGSRVEIIPNAGHLVTYEQLDRYGAIVEEFLTGDQRV